MEINNLQTFVLFLTLVTIFSGCLGTDGGTETKQPTSTDSLTIEPTKPTSLEATTTPKTQQPKKETSTITLKITDTNGKPLNGIAAFEKGFLHKSRYLLGTKFSNGIATVELPKITDPQTLVGLLDREYMDRLPWVDWDEFKVDEERFWGFHVYVTDHVYYPREIEVLPGQDYEFEVPLAPEPSPSNDPIISRIEFEKGEDKVTIKVEVNSPEDHLGPQDLAFNSKTGEIMVLTPPTPVESLRDDFPNGVYTLNYPDKDTDPSDWYFLAADHSCSNGPIQGYPLGQNIIPAYP
jgi:hypothetical protein